MERPAIIHKDLASQQLLPNWSAYEQERRRFTWYQARVALQGLPKGGLNMGFEAADRHAATALGEHVALRFVARNAPAHDVSYKELARKSSRFANVLQSLGVGKGDRLFLLAGRIPALYVALLGALKNGTVVTPLFSALDPASIATRVQLGAGLVLVTTDTLYQSKVRQIRAQMPTLRHVLLVAENGGVTHEPDTLDLATLMVSASGSFSTVATQEDDPALLFFSSGSSGAPKGVLHAHGAVVTHYATGRYALDLHPQDRYWCTADPGWVMGTIYGIIAPLLHGVTSLVDCEVFEAKRCYTLLEQEEVSVWYTAPTAIRMLMKAGPELAQRHSYPHLRFIACAGESLSPQAVWWGQDVFGLPIHDNWWQLETGSIMLANTLAFDIKPGAMGRPLPGIDAYIVEHLEAAGEPLQVRVLDTPNVVGELALKIGWPSMFRGYLNNPARDAKCFANDLYLTGDLARMDADGYFWFVGRMGEGAWRPPVRGFS